MSEEHDPLKGYPQILEFRAMVRRPRLLMAGNVVEFWIEKGSVYADAALVLGMNKYHDAEVVVKVILTKHPDGRDAKEREPGEDG